MLLHDLPEGILIIVLQRCVRASYPPAQTLKNNLPLLAVCRLWRRLAIPFVYNHVYVQYGERPKWNNDPFPRNMNVEEPADVVIKTNLGLIAVAGCPHAVKSVRIDVYCLASPFPGWREVIQRMRAVASNWRAVDLTVTMYPEVVHFGDRNVDMAKYTDDIVEVGDALVALMPDVCRLRCGGGNQTPIAPLLYGRMASHYADQLQRLDCQHPITLPPGRQFTKLEMVSISCDNKADYQPPQMASGELVSMYVMNGPANHSWAPFRAASDSQVIEFTKLKRLYVAYHTIYLEDGVAVGHRDGHPWQLQFPSLRNLNISCSQDICPLLEYAVLPPRMESISIDMKSASYQGIANVVLPASKRLSLRIDSQSRGDPSGLPAINRIVQSARGSESLELSINDRMLPVGPESITCTALTHLSVSGPTSVDTMLAIIGRLPNLVKLTFFDLDLSDIQADISIPEADVDAVVEPLHTSLNGLALNYNTRGHSPDMTVVVAVAKYVLLRIPSLTELLAAQVPKSPVASFVEEYASRYPRLSGVKLKLNESGGSDNTRHGFCA